MVRRDFVFVTAMVLAMGGFQPARAGGPSLPDWVHDAVHQTMPAFPGKPKAVILLNEQTYTVGPDGRAVEHVRMVVKILRPQGRDYGYPAVYFDKDSQVTSMKVWSIDPAGHEYAAKDNEIIEVGLPGEGGELYSDEKAKVANPPGRDPGGVVAYEYERKERPYLAETNWMFQGELPRLRQSFTLVLPAGYHYTTTWAHHAKVDGADLENFHYRWEMNDERAIDLDDIPLSPSGSALAARMTVHYTGPGMAVAQDGTWQGIGQWYEALARDRTTATPEIAAKAAELVAGKTDFYDRAEAIGEFVQKKIRYFVVEIGIGGNQPHYASEIYRLHYGDCKDKATLLAAMLDSVGMKGRYVMVDSQRGVVDPDDPSIIGDHMIGAIEIPKGYESPKLRSVVTAKNGKRYLIFDPTWELTPFGQLENNLQGSYGVLVNGEASQVIELPVMSPLMNTVRRKATFTLAEDGSLKGTVLDKRFGDLAEQRRYVFSRETAAKQQQYIDSTLQRDMRSVTLTDVKVENVESLNKDLTTSYSLAAAHFAAVSGPLLMVRPRVLGSYELSVDREARRVPIDLHEAMQGTDEFDIEIPVGYAVDELPEPVKLDMGFATYESATVVREGKLHYTRTYTLRAVTLPSDRYGEVRKLASVIAADEESRAVLKKN